MCAEQIGAPIAIEIAYEELWRMSNAGGFSDAPIGADQQSGVGNGGGGYGPGICSSLSVVDQRVLAITIKIHGEDG